ncbi:MAG TPA: hypothetical protein PK114_08665 [Smithellaceae bacterium]|nr:hypothetical protein [Smithellaceae bacterium]
MEGFSIGKVVALLICIAVFVGVIFFMRKPSEKKDKSLESNNTN